MSKPTPPKGLDAKGKKFWRKACAEFTFSGESDLEILGQMCRCIDRITQAAALIKKLGLVLINPTTKAVRPNPGLAIEHDNRILLARLGRELGMFAASDDSRPPRANQRR